MIISISPSKEDQFLNSIDSFNQNNNFILPVTCIGKVTDDDFFQIKRNDISIINLSVSKMKKVYENSISNRIESSN